MNKRFGFPKPYLTIALFLVWHLLAGEISGATVVMGLLLGWLLPLLTQSLWPDKPGLRKPWLVPLYVARVTYDIVVASVDVAILVLNFRRSPRPAFISYQLKLTHPMAISTLAGTISLTPGTVSADISDDGTLLLIHALDVEDDQALIDAIHNRYEKPLQEMFP
ncbi:Na+/H+ antiporter subunit E [Marinobacter salicampi]|uniref:Na+/H+ antiporter subunit E n=1 Tax=Marinobacter salicampi TaxID=435907 RepID=UPI00140D959D|nr:Na+/H+ antiporter subunit E [Marinobacter salicampi]